jgi:hypothetical protein
VGIFQKEIGKKKKRQRNKSTSYINYMKTEKGKKGGGELEALLIQNLKEYYKL